MLKKDELTAYKALLLSVRARMRGDVEQLTGEALDKGHANRDSRSPTHLAELGSHAFEQDISLRFVENDREVLGEIDAALVRIEGGTYGLCENCLSEGKPPSRSGIPKARLKAIPYARHCVHCEQKREELSL